MKNLINQTFLEDGKKLITFVTGGDPDFETSKDIGIQLSYIKHLHEAYEEMFFEKSFQEIPTLTIDMSKEYTEHDYIEMLVSTFPILKNFVIPQKT